MDGWRSGKRICSASSWDGLTQLAVLGVCFAAGALGGFFFSAAAGERQELADYLQRYFQMTASGEWTAPSLLASAWELFRWPLAALLLGLTALGAVGLPLLLAARGFILSFSAATFVRLFGLPGLGAAAAAFGLTAVIAVPVLFAVSQNAFRQSLARLSGNAPSPAPWSQRLMAQAPCLGLLILAVTLQQTVMPALLTAVCARLFVP